jgi:hypothetical protein
MGVGTSLHLLEAIVSNAIAYLNDDGGSDMTVLSKNVTIYKKRTSTFKIHPKLLRHIGVPLKGNN